MITRLFLLGLLSLSATLLYADTPPPSPPPPKMPSAPSNSSLQVSSANPADNSETSTANTGDTTLPGTANTTTTTTTKEVQTNPTNAAEVKTTTSTTQTTTQVSEPVGPVDCNTHVAPQTAITEEMILKWSEHAALQSFQYDFSTLPTQLTALKNCYTEQGWKSFNEALEKSGNLNTIKTQQLLVSSTINGKIQVSGLKDNQWKVNVPVQVTYDNKKEKLSQQLMINLIVGRKPNGDLGIMQMIAIPNNATATPVP